DISTFRLTSKDWSSLPGSKSVSRQADWEAPSVDINCSALFTGGPAVIWRTAVVEGLPLLTAVPSPRVCEPTVAELKFWVYVPASIGPAARRTPADRTALRRSLNIIRFIRKSGDGRMLGK